MHFNGKRKHKLLRKNIFKTIKWIVDNFKHREDVGVVIKTNMGTNTKIDKKLPTILFLESCSNPSGYIFNFDLRFNS